MRGYQNDDGTFAPLGVDRQPAAIAPATSARAMRTATITYVGRADDVFKASDYRISPFELESALIEHPAVAEAAVVPAPDPVRMAVPKAYVILAAGRRAGPATRRCRSSSICGNGWRRSSGCGGWSSPNLPKTISGKIRRVELRQTEEANCRRRHACRAPNSARRTFRS